MYLQLSIHKPHAQHVDDVVEVLRRFGEALEGQPGLVDTHTFQTPSGELIEIALWDSEEAFERGKHAGANVVKDTPLHEWESQPPIGFRGESLT